MNKPYELAEYLALERTIDAPVSAVWRLYLDMNRWYTDYHWDWVSGPPYDGVGLQEGQVLKAKPMYGVGPQDPTLFYYQEQLKVTKETEIVVKLTADKPQSMSAEYGTEVLDAVAFYHWDFSEIDRRTRIRIRSYSNIRTDKRPHEAIISDLVGLFYRSWNKCLDNLAALVAS